MYLGFKATSTSNYFYEKDKREDFGLYNIYGTVSLQVAGFQSANSFKLR
jgi:hypothetical protein